jgi:hypothetical protein
MTEITQMHKCNEGVELICEEERGLSKRRYVFSLVLTEQDIDKINKKFKEKK